MIPEPDDEYLSGAYAEVVMTVLDEADFLSTAWWPLKLVPRLGLPLTKSEADDPCQFDRKWIVYQVAKWGTLVHNSLAYDKCHTQSAKVFGPVKETSQSSMAESEPLMTEFGSHQILENCGSQQLLQNCKSLSWTQYVAKNTHETHKFMDARHKCLSATSLM